MLWIRVCCDENKQKDQVQVAHDDSGYQNRCAFVAFAAVNLP